MAGEPAIPRQETHTWEWVDQRARVELPIDQHLGEVCETVTNSQVAIIAAETGVGEKYSYSPGSSLNKVL